MKHIVLKCSYLIKPRRWSLGSFAILPLSPSWYMEIHPHPLDYRSSYIICLKMECE